MEEVLKMLKEKDKKNVKIAVVGAGPAGLAASKELLSYGFSVDIYEKEAFAGGVMAFGIPSFRFKMDAIAKQVEPVVALGCYFKFNQDLKESDFIRLAHEYDTVVASAGQGLTRGQTSMLFTDTYINQSVIAINPEPDYVIMVFCNLSNRYDELRNISDSTSIRGSITTKMIADLEIPIIESKSLGTFNENARNIVTIIKTNMNEILILSHLRDYLLSKLMSGEIDVSTLEIPN